MEFYLKLFLEAAWTASVVPLGNEPTYAAMRLFGGYNMNMALVIATAGASLGQVFNWGIGYALQTQRNNSKMKVSEHWYNKVSTIFNKYCIWLLLFCWAPLCKLLLVVAGFTRAPIKLVLPLVVVGNLLNYALPLL